jgi:hypothetical protein
MRGKKGLTMRTCFVFLILAILVVVVVVVPPVGAATIWDVEYFIRGDISQVTNFYDVGTYMFLATSLPQTTTVYFLQTLPIWSFIGYYACAPAANSSCSGIGGAVLPEGFPVIAFPPGYDEAIAVPIFQPDTLPGPSAAVPEPSTLLLMLSALTVYAVLLGRRALVGEPGGGGGR